MRRTLGGFAAFLSFTGTLLVFPVYAAPTPQAEPVETSSEQVDMGSLADPAPEADVQQGTTEPIGGVSPVVPTLTVSKTDTDPFSLVGVTWAYDPDVTETLVQVRVQDGEGSWGSWSTVSVEDDDQDESSDGGGDLRGGTAPLWTGPSRGVEVELVTRSGAQPVDVTLNLVDPGTSDADTSLESPEIQDTAGASTAMPDVFSRAQWGADESIRTWDPEYAPTTQAAAIHHTADTNNYTADQVPAMLRSIYRYHTVSRGWGDIGYNVIVDKFGRLWEGRYGGLASTVIGAHTGGFNTGVFGVSMLGNYDTAPTPPAMIDAVVGVIAWKFQLSAVDARGQITLTSSGGGTSKFAAGKRVTLPTIFGHRDVGSTSCPGQNGYAQLNSIRDRVGALLVRTPKEALASRYAADAALRARLGVAVGAESTEGAVTWQAYTSGRLYASSGTGVHEVVGSVLVKYLELGGPAVLGAPLTDELPTSDGVGRYNNFANGASIYWSPSTGAQAVQGSIRVRWAATGWESGALGFPTSDEVVSSGGARYTTFQGGVVYWSPATGAQEVSGSIYQTFKRLGGVSWQGLPTTGEMRTPDGVGRYNHFANGGSIYWSPSTGAHAVQGSIRARWAKSGWETGSLGFPVTDVATTAGAVEYVTFEGGVVVRVSQSAAMAVPGSIGLRYAGLGGPASRLGSPVREEYGVATGRRVNFEGGTITWNSTTGATATTFR